MGFCYGLNYNTGRYQLACDFCGKIGGVRKIPCKYGYCQAYATCPECRKEKKHLLKGTDNEDHCQCKEYTEDSQQKRKEVIAGGLVFNMRKWGVDGNDGGENRELYCVADQNPHFYALGDVMNTVWLNVQQLKQVEQMNHKLIFTDSPNPLTN